MAEYILCEKTVLDNIANSIRGKINSSDNMNIEDFSINIDNIPKGENRIVKISSDVGVYYFQTYNEIGQLVWNSHNFGDQINYTVTTIEAPVAKNGLIIGWRYMDHMGTNDIRCKEAFLEYDDDEGYSYGIYYIENDGEYIMSAGIPM